MCLAFDPGNRYGQTRVGAQSVTEKVTIRFNWNASTTIQKGKRYFSKVLTDGPISRINFCTIPEREIGAEMPVYGTYDEAFDEALRPYIDNLLKAQGLIDCPQAYELARTLKEECAEFARLSQSRVYENLSFRANVIAWLKACVLYVANDCRWTIRSTTSSAGRYSTTWLARWSSSEQKSKQRRRLAVRARRRGRAICWSCCPTTSPISRPCRCVCGRGLTPKVRPTCCGSGNTGVTLQL